MGAKKSGLVTVWASTSEYGMVISKAALFFIKRGGAVE
jgi:hypothetical protein